MDLISMGITICVFIVFMTLSVAILMTYKTLKYYADKEREIEQETDDE